MKLFTSFFLLILSLTAVAQVKQTPIAAKDIPVFIKYSGHIINAVRFTDKLGEYLIITTETGAVDVADPNLRKEGFSKADLYAYCYKIENGNPVLYWQMHDFSGDGPDHVDATYVAGTFAITDLDNNGSAEVWLTYLVGQRGDPVPVSMKIIMHEGNKKYAVRGESRVIIRYPGQKTQIFGGEYKLEDNFKDAPEVFKKYAQELWKKHMTEN